MIHDPGMPQRPTPWRGQPGQFIDGYQIIELLGQGGMGAVYRVRKAQRDYALKVMLKEHLDATDLAHFQREAQATAAIRHPHVIAVHTLQLNGAIPYILFDYVRGQSLDRLIDKPWTLEQALAFLRPIAEALDHVHDQGLVHRDLKPANIMVREHDRCPLLADFGLARGGDLDSLTQTGAVKGTPSYMAPEQFQGLEVDGRTDQWAFAVMLFELLTGGQRPFEGETPLALASAAMLSDAPSLASAVDELPEALDRVFAKALAKDKEDRYESVTEFLEDCERALRGEALEGKAPPSYKGALRSFRQGGARSALKLLILLLVFSGLLGGARWLWARQQKQTILSELGPDFTEEQFLSDFEAELGRRLLEKYTGTETPIVRPKYLLPTSHYQAKKDQLRSLNLRRGEAEEVVMTLHQKLQCSQSWDQLQGFRRKNYDRFIGKDPKEVGWLTDKFPRPCRGHLLAAFAFFSERWEDAYKQFRKVSDKTKGESVVLGQGLSAFKNKQYRATAEAFRTYRQDLGSDIAKALLFEALHREKAERLLEILDIRPLKELKGVLDKVGSSEDPKAWEMFNETIQEALRETPRALENSEEKVLRRYRQFDELRLFYPQLRPWPLTEPLLQSLIKDAEKKKYSKLTWLYSVLLHELNPKAKLPSMVLTDQFGRPVFASITAVIQGETKLSEGNTANITLQKEYDWLLTFARHGILLPFFSQKKLRTIKEAGLFVGEESDPYFRLFRGIMLHPDGWRTELLRIRKELREKKLEESTEAGRELWRKMQRNQSDVEYALKYGSMNRSLQCLAKRRLVVTWRYQAHLKIVEDPIELRERALQLLETIVYDHPYPNRIIETMRLINEIGRPWSETAEGHIHYSKRREKLIHWQFNELQEIKKGKRRSVRSALFPLSKPDYQKQLSRSMMTRAKALHRAKRRSESLKVLARSTELYLSLGDLKWFYDEALAAKSLDELLSIEDTMKKFAGGKAKFRKTEDPANFEKLLKSVQKSIRDAPTWKN